LLAEIPRALSAEMTERINEPSSIELTIAGDEYAAQFLVRPNRIRVYDVGDRPLETFIIWSGRKENAGGATTVRARGLSLASILSYERIDEDYVVDAVEEKTAGEVVKELLAFQENSPKIHVAAMDNALRHALATLSMDKGESIWTGLQRLIEAHGGYMWVNNSGGLYWRNKRGVSLGQEFRHGKNLQRVATEHDDSEVVTKLFVYGRAEGDTYLNLKDAGEDEEYLLAPLSYRNTYGIMKRFVQAPDITEPERLLKFATRFLAEHRDPPYTYEADVIDVSHSAEWDYDPLLGIRLGNKVTVYDDIIVSGSVTREFVEVKRNLMSPESTSATLGTLPKTVIDKIVEIDKFTKQKPNVPDTVHRFPSGSDFAVEARGVRDGDLAYYNGRLSLVKLTPPNGRYPGDYPATTAKLSQFAVIHNLPESGAIGTFDWQPGDFYYWYKADLTEESGWIGLGGVKHPFGSGSGDAGDLYDLFQEMLAEMLTDLGAVYRRVFISATEDPPSVPDGGWLATDMFRAASGKEYIRNSTNNGWVQWSKLGSSPYITDGGA